MGRDDVQTFEQLGPWGGLRELLSPKHIPPTDLVDCTNIQQDGGRWRPRPGYNSARDNPTSDFSTVKSSLNVPTYLVFEAAAARLYFIYESGTKIARVGTGGGAVTDIWTGLSNLSGIDIDTNSAPDLLYFCTRTLSGGVGGYIYTAAVDGSGSVAAISTATGLAGHSVYDVALNSQSAPTHVYYTVNDATAFLDRGVWRMTTAGGTRTQIVYLGTGSGGDRQPRCLCFDNANSRGFVTTSDGYIYRFTSAGASTEMMSGLNDPESICLDLTNNVLYWCENNSRTIKYATYTPATGALGTANTLFMLPSTVTLRGLDIDPATQVIYGADGTASTGSLFKSNSNNAIVSSFFWRRSLLGSSSTLFTDDLALLQMMNTTAGGSKFYAWFPSRTSSPDDLLAMTPGYTAGTSSNPDRFVMISRTANPSSTDPIIPAANYGRASFAYTGRGIDTYRGGVVMAASTGGYVFNYTTGDSAANEVQSLIISGTPTGGTFQLTLSTATANINYNANAAAVQAAIEGLAEVAVGDVTCAGGPLPGTAVTITFSTALANIGLPLLFMSTNGLTGGTAPQAIVTRTTKGRSHANGLLTLRPAGLPPVSSVTPSWAGAGAGNLNGSYKWAITYYSSVFNIESPPIYSQEIFNAGADYAIITWTNPSTLYFNNYFSATSVNGGPFVDFVRIYRKKTGTTAVGDGVGADLDYYWCATVQANLLTYRDNISDSSRTSSVAPAQKQYPPDDAQYVTILGDRAYYAGVSSSTKLVWNSEATKIGGVDDGELGHEYVSDLSFTAALDDSPNDHTITGLSKLGGQLVVATDERLFAADTSDVDAYGLLFRPVEGSVGSASHWCMVETNPLIGDEISGGLLLYAHPKGGMYSYNGSTSEPISRDNISETIKSFSPKTWQDVELGFGSIVSWYWASAVLDPYNNRIIMSAPLKAGGQEVMVYDLDTKTWLSWNLNKLAWMRGREWESGTTQGRDVILFCDGASIQKMSDGADDNGMSFSWNLTLGRWNLGTAQKKILHDMLYCFDRKTFGGTAPTITSSVFLNNSTTALKTTSAQLDADDELIANVGARARYFQFKLSGTQTDQLDHAGLVSITTEFKPVGIRAQ